MEKEEIVLIKAEPGAELSDVVDQLIKYREQGLSVVCKFNDELLYSDTVTMDSAYIQVCGSTKEEFDKSIKQLYFKLKQLHEDERDKAIKMAPEIIERGKKIVYPQRQQEWEDTVIACTNGIYNGYEVRCALELMELMEQSSLLDDLIKVFESQNHSGMSASIVRLLVLLFSKDGYSFYCSTHVGDWSIEEYDFVQSILEKNNEYSREEYKNKNK